jgi:hypothetical protein
MTSQACGVNLGMDLEKRGKKGGIKYGILKVCTRKPLNLAVHHTNSQGQKTKQITCTGKYPYKNAGREGEV